EELHGAGTGGREREPEREAEHVPQVEEPPLPLVVLALDEAVGEPGLSPDVVARLHRDDLRLGVLQARDLGVEGVDQGLRDVQRDVDGLTREAVVVPGALCAGEAPIDARDAVAVVEAHQLHRLALALLLHALPGLGDVAERLVALLGGLAVPDELVRAGGQARSRYGSTTCSGGGSMPSTIRIRLPGSPRNQSRQRP